MYSTNQECVLFSSTYVYTYVLTRSVCYQECVLTRRVYKPEVCSNQECVTIKYHQQAMAGVYHRCYFKHLSPSNNSEMVAMQH